MCHPLLLAATGAIVFGQSSAEVRDAVSRALPPLERSAAAFVEQRSCVSCHHNLLTVLTFHLARDRGLAIDSKTLSAVEDKTFRELRGASALDHAVQASTLNDPTPEDSYLLMAAHAAGLAPDAVTGIYALRLARWQQHDGHWVTSDFRPPHSSSVFTATATAVRAVRWYMPEELRSERDAVVSRARGWLFQTRPASTEDASFRLMGLVWAEASADEIAAARHDLLSLETAAGGWPQLPGYPGDAYSTGEALFALHESGATSSDSAWRKGARFLISTQAGGVWRVHTRMISPADVSPKYFTTGFPYGAFYGKDEYLSDTGSAWAAMALLESLPETTPHAAPVQGLEAPAWVRTALFGTPRELQAALDAGLDPNRHTEGGATLLMMAARDAEKIRLLIARGADVNGRAPSGSDALTVAAGYRAAASMRLLLDAGAETQPPPGVRAAYSPLVLAAMTGDLESVRALLARGADPNAAARGGAPLAQAVTFGYREVVQALIAAGASVKMTESSGINLIHWAAIANRPSVIPALVAAGTPVNAQDQFGFTPLMYAATIDFGDAESVKTLLRAGADPTIRNLDGRTPVEQARHLGHTRLEAALRHAD
ncbi:MAG TPA: ankyrin repeat domain-containing protein [Bryobacteraceae bacterium]